MRENKFQANLIKEIKEKLPGCVVLKNDAGYLQGVPDLLILHEDNWAALECKKHNKAKVQPNQKHYIDSLNGMSYAAFVCPENKEDVLNELQHTFTSRRSTRVSKCK